MKTGIHYVFLSMLFVSVGCGQVVEPSPIPYMQRLAEFQTKLTKTGPAPQDFDQEIPFANVKEIIARASKLLHLHLSQFT